jgi:SAM-dependent methyltransferase
MLYDHPEVYDALLHPEAHGAHYAALADRHPGPVLELACGSGQLTVPLAKPGRPVVGLDLSPPMLAAARQRATAAGAAIEFIEADMRSFSLGRQFALIFVARNSLLHLSGAEDFVATFAAVRRHLAPGGVFAFDVFNPDVRRLARPAGERAFVMPLRSIFPQELPLLLTLGGFRLLSRAGDLTGSAFTKSSSRQVCLCEPIAVAN